MYNVHVLNDIVGFLGTVLALGGKQGGLIYNEHWAGSWLGVFRGAEFSRCT
jgi:hypothetical protein